MNNTERERVMSRAEMCDLGERLVDKALLDQSSNGRLIEHFQGCPQCAKAMAS